MLDFNRLKCLFVNILWIKLHNGNLHNLQSSYISNSVMVIKVLMVRQARKIVCMRETRKITKCLLKTSREKMTWELYMCMER